MCRLCSDSESGSAKQQDINGKSDIYAAGGDCDVARTRHYSKINIFFRNLGVKQIPTDY